MPQYYASSNDNRVWKFWNGNGWTYSKDERKTYSTMKEVSQSIHKMWKGQKPKNDSAAYNILRTDGKPLTDEDYKTA